MKDFFYRLGHWETWHWHVKYIPIYPAWLWYCLRSGSFWFFTSSNPTLTFGGFEGENKREMYKQLPEGSYPPTIFISFSSPFTSVIQLVSTNNINYPFIVKPDVGMMGFMFRKINTEEELLKYHNAMPVDYLIQSFSHYPHEVSVFYYRFPYSERGHITGFIKKEFLQVSGDGKSTLLELINNYPRVRFRIDEMISKHKANLPKVIPMNEIYYLSYALNLSRGGRLVSLEHEKDERLLKVFDNLSQQTKYFYYGRYDIKCASIEDLKSGKNYSILEFNGSGAEPHHAYGNGNTLLQAYKIFLHHWDILYRISSYNNAKGIPYWGFLKGIKFLKAAVRHFTILKKIDRQFPASSC